MVYLLALGSPTHAVGPDAWTAWTQHLRHSRWGTLFGQEFLGFAPLFGHQYTHVWIDFRELQDAYMRRRGLDYFENTRRARVRAAGLRDRQSAATARATAPTIWGLTASDGPARHEASAKSSATARMFRTLRGARRRPARARYDDCTLAPTAAVGIAAVRARDCDSRGARHAQALSASTSTRKYGFLDAFNPSFDLRRAAAARPRDSRVRLGRRRLPRHRPGRDLRHDRELPQRYDLGRDAQESVRPRRGLQRAGFTGGWLTAVACNNAASAHAVARSRARAAARRCASAASSLLSRPARRRDRRHRRRVLGDGPRRRSRRRSCCPSSSARIPASASRSSSCRGRAAHEKLLTAFAGDATPDICQLGNTWIPEFVALGALEPLEPYVAASSDDRRDAIIFRGIWDTNVVDGALYGVPWYVDTRLLFYRTRSARAGRVTRAAARLGGMDAR